jgi:tight adherence protein B
MTEGTLFAGMIFVIVLLMTQAFVAPLMGSRRQARQRLRARIRDLGSSSEGAAHASLVRDKYLQRFSPWERRLESLGFMGRIRDALNHAGVEQPAYRMVMVCLALTVIAGLLAFWQTASGATALVVSTVAALTPYLLLQRRRHKRLQAFEEQLSDALSVVARSLRAGMPFSEALHIVATEMPEPVGKEFGRVFSELNYGGDVKTALLGMLERMPTVAVMGVVTAVLIQRETGGNLAEVLDRISGLLRQRFRFQRSLRTLTAEGRGTAWVVAVMPFALAAVAEMLSPGWITDFVRDPTGRQLFIGAFVMMVVGILWLRRLVRIDV